MALTSHLEIYFAEGHDKDQFLNEGLSAGPGSSGL